ncbi:MAG: Twin-arginine translocation pathway signal [Candidatus Woesebacteria bacterium GW2011_GWB1_43_14]|uniref:Twin-arginine translocation pathway signal n=1 Tax=Candidatus Woesebacteria bacterium GW2011_GWB1_43_14 TaxID=1618578 RepID=A0A0G1FQL4_9BACT|nr:MAG: Twin-arginine translocation pathway signal [Candidatus Woesebacteria bacterium GW2011_GWA1_39_11b]KKS97326.1 MAG: Twin-arginine translocation pathway signal [Candidatus Woesebacteria bacterium GW2011_GWB1_43_14]
MFTQKFTIGMALIIIALLFGSFAVQAQDEEPMTYEEAMACVLENFPASGYTTNEFVPTDEDLADIVPLDETVHLRVGMPWVLNDEEAPWYIAEELGYFAEEGLEIELVAGGPGINHLLTLGGGVIDIAVVPGGAAVPRAIMSETPVDVVVVGTFLKGMPYTYITIDPELLGRELTPEDLIGRTVAIQSDADVYLNMLLDMYEIPRDQVEVSYAGFTSDCLLVGQCDFYSGWIMNQPRMLEQEGHEWNGLQYRDWVYDEYSDVIIIRPEMLEAEEGRDIVNRFLRATYRGIQFLLDNPEESAEIAVVYGVDADLTVEQAMWRFEQQEHLVIGNDGLGLMATSPDVWDDMVAMLVQYGQIKCGD